MMGEVASRMGITDPNDPLVQAEVERLLEEQWRKGGEYGRQEVLGIPSAFYLAMDVTSLPSQRRRYFSLLISSLRSILQRRNCVNAKFSRVPFVSLSLVSIAAILPRQIANLISADSDMASNLLFTTEGSA